VNQKIIFGDEDHWAEAQRRNSKFFDLFPHLLDLLHLTFSRQLIETKPIDRVVFTLGRCCVEDFFEIILLAGNGYGIAAAKILRGLYERAVTMVYLIDQPEEVDNFLQYHHIQEHKLAQAIIQNNGEEAVNKEIREEREKHFNAVKDNYMIDDCKKCGTLRLNHTWSKLDVVSMARKTPWLKKYLVLGYYIPMSYAHSTVHSMLARLEENPEGGMSFNPEAQPKQADDSLRTAHILILYIVREQYRHFKLKDPENLGQRAELEFKEIWPMNASKDQDNATVEP
jgi:hypothetical protein